MAIQLAAAARTVAADAIVDNIDAGGGAGSLIIYAGAVPDPDSAAGTALAAFSLAATSFGAASDNGTRALATMAAVSNATASGTGTAAYFRVLDNAAAVQFQGTVGTTGADLIIDNTSISSGNTVAISSFTFQCDQVR